jgi:hypothetical protein
LRVPTAEQEPRLQAAAARLGEDVDVLRARLAELQAIELECRGVGGVVPWPEPVSAGALLDDTQKLLGSYVIIHDEHGATATTLWVGFSWIHDVATHSPPLLATSADAGGNAAKTLLAGLLQLLTPRGKIAGEITGASFFHMIDRTHPTLIIDNAENLFNRRRDLLDLLAQSWTRGTPVLRQVHGQTYEFDVFCPKVVCAIAGSNFLPANMMQRMIHFEMLPKLPSETRREQWTRQGYSRRA